MIIKVHSKPFPTVPEITKLRQEYELGTRCAGDGVVEYLELVLDGVRWSMLGMPAPSTGAVFYLIAFAAGALALGVVTFTRAEHELTDVI